MKIIKLFMISTYFTLLATTSVFSTDSNDPVDHHNVKRIVEGHLTRHPTLLDSSQDKDIVVFLGNTAAGKSTLINYLSGKRLRVNDVEEIVLEEPTDSSAMPIGVGSSSETFLPRFIQVDNLLFYDLPGFRDTRGTATNLVNACFIKRIIENARSAKLVFVAGADQITADRGSSFKTFLRQAKQLIPNRGIENFSCLIITKSHQPLRTRLPHFLETKLEFTTNSVTTDPGLLILQSWINNEKLDQMRRPINSAISSDEKVSILNLIGAMNSENISSIDISIVYDADQQIRIREIYNAEIESIVERLILQNFQPQLLSTLNKDALRDKENYITNNLKQFICLDLSNSPLIRLLRPISDNLYQSAWSERERILDIRIGGMASQIRERIQERQRQEEEARRLQAEVEARQAQESVNRINQEIAQLRIEQAKRDREYQEVITIEREKSECGWSAGGCFLDFSGRWVWDGQRGTAPHTYAPGGPSWYDPLTGERQHKEAYYCLRCHTFQSRDARSSWGSDKYSKEIYPRKFW